MNRTRGVFLILSLPLPLSHLRTDVINTMTYACFAGGPITIDHENIVKAYSASSSMLGRGHLLLEPQGPIWVNTSYQLMYVLILKRLFTVTPCIGLSPTTQHRFCGW